MKKKKNAPLIPLKLGKERVILKPCDKIFSNLGNNTLLNLKFECYKRLTKHIQQRAIERNINIYETFIFGKKAWMFYEDSIETLYITKKAILIEKSGKFITVINYNKIFFKKDFLFTED